MTRRSTVVVLCEDKQQEVFFYRLLRRMGYARTQITILPYPHGRSDAKAYVRATYARQVAAQRNPKAASDLVTVADADADDTEALRRILDGLLAQHRQADERIAVFIPKWCIETWVAYLTGDRAITEETPYPPRLRGHESDCAPAVVEYHRMATERRDTGGRLPSLDASFAEYARLRQP